MLLRNKEKASKEENNKEKEEINSSLFLYCFLKIFLIFILFFIF